MPEPRGAAGTRGAFWRNTFVSSSGGAAATVAPRYTSTTARARTLFFSPFFPGSVPLRLLHSSQHAAPSPDPCVTEGRVGHMQTIICIYLFQKVGDPSGAAIPPLTFAVMCCDGTGSCCHSRHLRLRHLWRPWVKLMRADTALILLEKKKNLFELRWT